MIKLARLGSSLSAAVFIALFSLGVVFSGAAALGSASVSPFAKAAVCTACGGCTGTIPDCTACTGQGGAGCDQTCFCNPKYSCPGTCVGG